jgi:type II secretory pathway pseudopilin PulG
MRVTHHARVRRGGFTLVELLVAAAVSILLMVILTEAFKRGIDMFRTLRAQGQLQERLRLASIGMRDDLASFHFDSPKNGSASQNQNYLSDIDLRTSTSSNLLGVPGAVDQPPELGFFRIIQLSDLSDPANNPNFEPCKPEGTDGDGMLFTRATTHALHFTVLRRERSPAVISKNPVDPSYLFRTQEALTVIGTPMGPRAWPNNYIDPPDFREQNTFSSRWAEVAYFLYPSGRSANGTQLYNLYRRQKALVPDPDPTGPTGIPTGDVPYTANTDISFRQQYVQPPPQQPVALYNRPGIGDGLPYGIGTGPGITQPCNRFSMQPADTTNDPRCAGVMGSPASNYMAPPPYLGWVPYPRLQDETTNVLKIGDDIVLSDVLSFEIKVMWDSSPQLIVNPNPGPPVILNPAYVAPPRLTYNFPNLAGVNTVNTDYPFDYLPVSPQNQVLSTPNAFNGGTQQRVFDTWSGNDRVKNNLGIPADKYARPRPGAPAGAGPAWSDTTPAGQLQTGARIPLRIRVRAVMIRLRIWDAKAEQTRQMTIIMDL